RPHGPPSRTRKSATPTQIRRARPYLPPRRPTCRARVPAPPAPPSERSSVQKSRASKKPVRPASQSASQATPRGTVARMRRLVVGHLFPDYLNIYADRGNIAVLSARAAWRGYELEVRPLGAGAEIQRGEHDLFYVGGGQDREQALIAPKLAALGPALHEAFEAGAAFLAVCGGYQLLGHFYRDQSGEELPGSGLLPLHTVAGSRRMIGDVLLECELESGSPRTLAGFENHAGRTILDEGAEPLGRVLAGFGNDGESGYE